VIYHAGLTMPRVVPLTGATSTKYEAGVRLEKAFGDREPELDFTF